ncbi:hypothetical protein EVAR_10725_1 [Eumeta japonica]|uniref:Uncharacterized protein n=1 Tax=Eumeta variegata TaxID=151549 RepID=A0A4C1U769_EUMVA|nr:hypothetical protein EVAR_10725_1 [Eumeta japonica]
MIKTTYVCIFLTTAIIKGIHHSLKRRYSRFLSSFNANGILALDNPSVAGRQRNDRDDLRPRSDGGTIILQPTLENVSASEGEVHRSSENAITGDV